MRWQKSFLEGKFCYCCSVAKFSWPETAVAVEDAGRRKMQNATALRWVLLPMGPLDSAENAAQGQWEQGVVGKHSNQMLIIVDPPHAR